MGRNSIEEAIANHSPWATKTNVKSSKSRKSTSKRRRKSGPAWLDQTYLPKTSIPKNAKAEELIHILGTNTGEHSVRPASGFADPYMLGSNQMAKLSNANSYRIPNNNDWGDTVVSNSYPHQVVDSESIFQKR